MSEKYFNREVKEKKEFKVDGTFQSMWSAQSWLYKNGYCYGSTCAPSPFVAILKGTNYGLPQKWKNFNKDDIKAIDGVMVSNNYREGQVTIYLF